jgi:hypothetical protein
MRQQGLLSRFISAFVVLQAAALLRHLQQIIGRKCRTITTAPSPASSATHQRPQLAVKFRQRKSFARP